MKINRGHTFENLNFNHALLGEKYVWGRNCWLKLQIKNSGQSVIEDFKIELDFEGDFEEAGVESKNVISERHLLTMSKDIETQIDIKPKNSILCLKIILLQVIFLSVSRLKYSGIILKWKLLSKDFTDSGCLLIKIVPKYHTFHVNER